jgi:hypothetical protein
MPRRYTPLVTRKSRVTRAVYGVFIVLVAAFVVSNIWQVARALFGASESAAEVAAAAKVHPDCAAAIAREIEAIEKARSTASMEANGEAAKDRYDRERRSSQKATDTVCAAEPQGSEALAALARLERAAKAHAVRDATELRPVRLAAQSFIRGQPR